jgi:hypothetical protein
MTFFDPPLTSAGIIAPAGELIFPFTALDTETHVFVPKIPPRK